MANLTVENQINVINVEIFHGLDRDRAANGTSDEYLIINSSVMGAPCTYYSPTNNNLAKER